MYQSMLVQVHHPRVKRVQRFESDGGLLITFGNNDIAGRGEIEFFISNEQWAQAIADVERLKLDAGIIPTSPLPAVKNDEVAR
jgi:hypothetical protein